MPVQIKVEDNTYQEKLVTLNGNSLFITFSFNTRDGSWYFDTVDRNGKDIISGVKITPLKNLTDKYIALKPLIGGAFFCIDTKLRRDNITRDNFGTDKQFQFWYYTDKEIGDLSNVSTV